MPPFSGQFIAVTAFLCLLIAVVYLLPRQEQAANLGARKNLSASPRHSPGQLRALALARATTPATTNSIAPFVTLLGPGATTYLGSMVALRDLPAILSSNQVVTLRAVVSIPYNTSMPFSALEFNGIKNVAADILLQQPAFPAEFLADLVLQHAEPTQDEVWRDYCLQMLTTGYINLAGRAGVSDPAASDPDVIAARELALNTLMTATTAGGPTWPGTALLGLNTILASEPSAFPREELDKRILAAISDASASEAALITASRLAGMARLESARSTLESLSKSSSSELVRTAASKSLSDLSAVALAEEERKPTVTAISNKAIRQ